MLEEVELREMEQFADIADEAVPEEVLGRGDVGGVAQIGGRGVEAEIVVDQLRHLQPPRRRPADRDDDVGVAPGEAEHGRGGDELDR